MAKTSGSANPGGKGRSAGGGKAGAPAGAKPKQGAAKAATDPAASLLAPTAPRASAARAAATDDSAGADGPCYEFRQVIDEDGNPVLRKVQVPCPEK